MIWWSYEYGRIVAYCNRIKLKHSRCLSCCSYCKGVFIVCCNAAALPMYRLHIYCSSTQRTAPQVHFLAVLQCSGRCRDGNTATAIYHNAAAVNYECNFRIWKLKSGFIIPIVHQSPDLLYSPYYRTFKQFTFIPI